MLRWKKRRTASTPELPEVPGVPAELTALVDAVRVECLALQPSVHAPEITGSFVGGHPYWPAGAQWPEYLGQPMTFVCQLNFAELPRLGGFPETGIFQWFAGSDDTMGLTFDDTAGAVGFEVRMVDIGGASTRGIADLTPAHRAAADGIDIYFALDATSAIGLEAHRAETVPSAEAAEALESPALAAWAEAMGERPGDAEFVWDEYVRGPSGPFGLWAGSTIGGTPRFTQYEVAGTGSYADAASPAAQVLIQLDSNDFPGWGDAGIGHLFGDPAAVAVGDLSGVRYHWDCL